MMTNQWSIQKLGQIAIALLCAAFVMFVILAPTENKAVGQPAQTKAD